MIDEAMDLPVNRDPYLLPVTMETWERLPKELLHFYADRGTAPTELAARILLNRAQAWLDRQAPVTSPKALFHRAVVMVGRKAVQSENRRGGRKCFWPEIPAARGG